MWRITPSHEAAKASAGVLADPGRNPGRPDHPRLHRPRLGHPLPRRPLPGPVRPRQEDLRPAANPRVRRRVHPRPHARTRRSTSSAWNPTRPAPAPTFPAACASSTRPAAPATSCSAPSPAPRPVGEAGARHGPVGADPPHPRRPARRRQEPVRGLDHPLPPAHRGHEGRQACNASPRPPNSVINIAVGDSLHPRPGRHQASRTTVRRDAGSPHLPDRGRGRATSRTSTSSARTPTMSWSATRLTSRSRTPPRTRTTATAYTSCSGTYALSVPFAERFFHLATVAAATDAAPVTSARSPPTRS